MADLERLTVTHVNIRTSIMLLLLRLILLDIFGAVFVVIYFSTVLGSVFSSDIKAELFSFNFLFFLILVITKIGLTVFVVLEWLNEYYEITPKNIIYKRGLIFREIDRFSLDKVRAVGVQQGIFGKLINSGTVTLYDVRLNKYIDLFQIHNPMKYLHVLEDLIPNLEERKTVLREHMKEEEVS